MHIIWRLPRHYCRFHCKINIFQWILLDIRTHTTGGHNWDTEGPGTSMGGFGLSGGNIFCERGWPIFPFNSHRDE